MRRDLYKDLYKKEHYYWWHIRKRRLISNLMNRYLNRESVTAGRDLQILDIGCGTGKMMEELRYFGTVYGVDNSNQAIGFCKKKGLKNVCKADINYTLPFPDQTFDVVLLLDVLEHIEDDRAALREIKRILKKGGILLLTVPAYQSLFSYWDKMLLHKRRYNKKGLSRKIRELNFKILKMSYFNSFILIPALFFRWLKGKLAGGKLESDFIPLPFWLNSLLLNLSYVEDFILKRFNVPFGLSIVVVVKR